MTDTEMKQWAEQFFKANIYDGKLWLPPIGNPKAKLMIVISYPSKDDVESQRILSGGNGMEIQNALDIAGFEDDDVYITSMVKFGIGDIAKPTTKQIAACAETLAFELQLVQPKLIMTLGSEPFKAVMKANAKQTDFLGEVIDSPYGKLIPNYSPGMILTQDPTKRPVFREIFDYAYRYIHDKLAYTDFQHIRVDDPAIARQIVDYYIKEGKLTVGYDAEWKGKKMTDDEVMYTFQFSCEPHKAVVLQISKDGKTENRELLDAVRPLIEHPQACRLGWNIRADDKRLTLRGFKIPEETIGCDGMKLCGFIDSRWPKGLETGIKKFTNYKPYYNDMMTAIKAAKLAPEEMADVMFHNPEVFWEYCAGDAVAHRTACLAMMEHFRTKFPKGQQDYYYQTYLPLSNYFLDLELSGIPIDQEAMEEITTMFQSKYDELSAKLTELVRPLGFDSSRKAALESDGKWTEAEKAFEDFNPASVLHKRALLYDKLQLTAPYFVKKAKTRPREWWLKQKPNTQKQYAPSTNGKSMATLKFDLEKALKQSPDDPVLKQTYEIISVLLSLNRVSVFANKFFSKKGTEFNQDEEDEGEDALKASYWAALCKDGRIHPDFFECLANFRSSSKPNVQNAASKVLSHIPDIFVPGYSKMSKEEQKKHEKEIPRNPRHIFYPGDKDWYWVEVDVAGADLAIAAFLSGDPDYIFDIRKGSFHVTKMREYFRNPKLTKDHYSSYVTAKSITFRVAYTAELLAAALPIQAEIYAESGIFVDRDQIEYALLTWERYKKYMEFRKRCMAQVDQHKYIENFKGIKYHFEDSENFSIVAGWKNESLAYPIASELALFLWDISVSIKRELQKNGIWMKWCKPVNSVHDASYWTIHKDLLKDGFFPELCKHYFTRACTITTGDTLGMEMVVSDRWKGKEKFFSKETAWNFETSCWDWKA